MQSDIQTAVETWIAGMDEAEFRCLVARTRPPDEPMPPMPANREGAQHD
jgi:hypothetical protein